MCKVTLKANRTVSKVQHLMHGLLEHKCWTTVVLFMSLPEDLWTLQGLIRCGVLPGVASFATLVVHSNEPCVDFQRATGPLGQRRGRWLSHRLEHCLQHTSIHFEFVTDWNIVYSMPPSACSSTVTRGERRASQHGQTRLAAALLVHDGLWARDVTDRPLQHTRAPLHPVHGPQQLGQAEQ